MSNIISENAETQNLRTSSAIGPIWLHTQLIVVSSNAYGTYNTTKIGKVITVLVGHRTV